ncbi:MAG: ribonuclease J [Actinomycetia bacterium]|nr:ribonuclease J [Actinomycetes bacterium]
MADPVRVSFLGGLGDIGRNCATIEIEDRLMILDCGQMFPDEMAPGVDSILPDFAHLRANADRIEGCVVTHGHEDHIGALPHALREFEFPIYGSRFTLDMVRHKLDEADLLHRTELIPVADNERRQIGPFDCEFLPVTHSIPHGNITAFHTPQGVVLHSSDFKLDLSPVDGRVTDLARIGAISATEGIRLLLADSTNAESPGHSASESAIGPVLKGIMQSRPDQRIIVASFASHIHRVRQIVEMAVASGRVVATLGLSMRRNVQLAREHGLLDIPEHLLVDVEELDRFEPGRVCIVSTGSQGEERSALNMLATGQARWFDISPDDTVILSSHPIPGNEAAVGRMVNDLVRRGAEVIGSGQVDVHTSGHGKRNELSTFHQVVRPEFFVPVHGEFRHLVAHAELAEELGMPDDNVIVCQDGDSVVLGDDGLRRGKAVGGQYIHVQGRTGRVEAEQLTERRILGAQGFVAVVVSIDGHNRRIVDGPTLVSRGWVDTDEHEELVTDGEVEVAQALEKALADPQRVVDAAAMERVVRRAIGRYVNDRTRRRPMIVPSVSVIRA